jgi:hypothetical protein
VVPIVINQDWQVLTSIMAVVYAVVLFLLAASYKSTFGIDLATMDKWATSAYDAFPEQFNTAHGYGEGS